MLTTEKCAGANVQLSVLNSWERDVGTLSVLEDERLAIYFSTPGSENESERYEIEARRRALVLITKANAIARTLVARPTRSSSLGALVSASGTDATMHDSIL